MAKGKSFEHLVRLIQELLKDHPATRVLHNQKLTSRTGRKRQFDVLIETSVNGYPLRVAIECKDHNRKVEAEAIEAFHCKCELVGGINKLVFVSNTGFQEGAITSATELGVTLHILKEVTGEQIVGWIDTAQIYQLRFFKRFKAVNLVFDCQDEDLPKSTLNGSNTVFYTNGENSTLQQFIDSLTNEKTFQRIVENLMMMAVVECKNDDVFKEEKHFEPNIQLPQDAFIKSEGKDLFIKEVTIQLGISVRREQYSPEIRVLQNPAEARPKVGILTFNDFDKDGKKMQMVLNPETGNFKHFITTKEGETLEELVTLAKFDPVTRKWAFPSREKKQFLP